MENTGKKRLVIPFDMETNTGRKIYHQLVQVIEKQSNLPTQWEHFYSDPGFQVIEKISTEKEIQQDIMDFITNPLVQKLVAIGKKSEISLSYSMYLYIEYTIIREAPFPNIQFDWQEMEIMAKSNVDLIFDFYG